MNTKKLIQPERYELLAREDGLPDGKFLPAEAGTMDDGSLSDPYYVVIRVDGENFPLPIVACWPWPGNDREKSAIRRHGISAALAHDIKRYIDRYNAEAAARGDEHRAPYGFVA